MLWLKKTFRKEGGGPWRPEKRADCLKKKKHFFLFFKIISLQSLVGGPGALIGGAGFIKQVRVLAEKFGEEKH